MKCFFRRRRCVWGRDIEMLTLRVADPVGRGFLRSGTEPNPRPRELVVRPVSGEDRYFVMTRWDSREHYEAWAAARPTGKHVDDERRGMSVELLGFDVVQHDD